MGETIPISRVSESAAGPDEQRRAQTNSIQKLVIYLIKPSNYDEDGYVIRYWRGVLPSNTLACLYGLTEDVRRREALGKLTWRINLIDETVQKVNVRGILRENRRQGTKVIACLVGVQSNQFVRASDLALELRKGNVDVLIGGFHVSGSIAMSNQLPPEIRYLIDLGVTVVAGEIEGRWQKILQDALSGTLKSMYNFLEDPPQLDAVPMPRISKNYMRRFVAPNLGTLDCGRGCPFNCSFCTVINVQGRTMRFRSVDALTALLRDNYHRQKISYYFLTDDNFCRNKHWEQILDSFIQLRRDEGIRISFMAQVDTQSYKMPRFVSKMKAAGCSQVFIGIESLNSRNLEAAGKRQNAVESFKDLMSAYREAEITTHVAYIIGFPFDTLKSVREDVERLKTELAPQQASFFVLTPLPGSRDHMELTRQGVPLDPDLNRYDSFHTTLSHPLMTQDEWQRAYEEAWNSFYGLDNMKAVLRRIPPKNYWGTFSHCLWYKNAIMVEGGHPMVHGFIRLKGRFQRRSGLPIETHRQYLVRRVKDAARCLRLWVRLALEMEELWLQTRPRGEFERLVIQELQRRRIRLRSWRELRLAELQRIHYRASILLKKASPRMTTAWPRGRRAAIPSRARLWLKKSNVFSHSLTASRKSLKRFWRKTNTRLRRGHFDRINVNQIAFNFAQESLLLVSFLCACLRQVLPYFFGRVASARK